MSRASQPRRSARRPALLVSAAIASCAALPAAAAAGHRAVALAGAWHATVAANADRELLAAAFRQAGYTPPRDSYLLAARIKRGVGQAAFQYFSLGDTAFSYSAGKYWPASTVKLMATVGALWTLGKHGLTGDAIVELTDPDGTYRGPVHELYDRALRISENIEYNRLMLIAGHDELNGEYMTAAHGMPRTALQRRYGVRRPGVDRELRASPEIRYREGERTGVIPARRGKLTHPECPELGNCTSLFELQEGLRRLALHDELPASERFPIQELDRRRVLVALAQAKHKFGDGAAAALGHPVEIFNKAGRYPGDDHLDNALIVDTVTKQRYLVALSVKYGAPKEPDEVSAQKLVELGGHTLRMLASRRGAQAPWLQRDAGVPIEVRAAPTGRPLAFAVEVTAARADRLRVWIDGKLQREAGAPPPPAPQARGRAVRRTFHHTFAGTGEHPVVVEASRRGRAVGYRALLLRIEPAAD